MISIELNSIQPVQWPEKNEPYQNPKLYFTWSKPTSLDDIPIPGGFNPH